MNKVLHLRSSGDILGAENVIIEIARNSERFGYYSIIGAIKDIHDPYPEFLVKAKTYGIECVVFEGNGKIDIHRIQKLNKYLFSNEIDIIHSHGYKEDSHSFFLSKKVLKIATNHLWKGDDLKSKLYFFVDQFFLKSFNRVVAVSEEIKNDMLSKGIRNISKIQNGVDTETFFPRPKSQKIMDELGFLTTDFIIGMISSITPEKGHTFALDAFYEMVKVFPEIKLLILGEGPLKISLKEKIVERSLESKVIFVGKRTDISEILSVFDLYLLPSLKEGLPISLLEAMAAGVPAISSKVGEIGNVIINRENGFLVEPGNTEALKDTLYKVLSNKKILNGISIKAAAYIKEKYSSSKMTEEYCKLYNSILNSNTSKG